MIERHLLMTLGWAFIAGLLLYPMAGWFQHVARRIFHAGSAPSIAGYIFGLIAWSALLVIPAKLLGIFPVPNEAPLFVIALFVGVVVYKLIGQSRKLAA